MAVPSELTTDPLRASPRLADRPRRRRQRLLCNALVLELLVVLRRLPLELLAHAIELAGALLGSTQELAIRALLSELGQRRKL